MNISRNQSWRLAFIPAGIAMAMGGSRHPSGDAEDSLTGELATMTADDGWVMSHTLLAVGAALLAGGLWLAYRHRSWPSATWTALRLAAIAMSLYVVETLFHLGAVVDADALADGGTSPVAVSHVALAIVLYPISGLCFAWLSVRVVQSATLPLKTFGVAGIVAGVLHATSVPLTLVFPDVEFSPAFASAGILLAAWSLCLGLFGMRTETAATTDLVGSLDEMSSPYAEAAMR